MNYLKLKHKINSNKAIIGIIGLGYVGIPLLKNFLKKNFKVIGVDNSLKKINLLNKAINPINNKKEISSKKKPFFSKNYKHLKSADIIIICLPTPLNNDKSPDMSYINDCRKSLFKFLKPNQLLILESTTYPGTTNDLFYEKLKKKFKFGENFFLGYSPEREDPGNQVFKLSNTIKLVSGKTDKCLKLTYALYKKIVKKLYKVENLETAEMTKLFENVFRSVNIGLVNEMKVVCDKMNLDINKIINAAKTKKFGFMPFYPGPGLGGHCIPIDPHILSWKAKKFGAETKFIKLSAKINADMPKYIMQKLLNDMKKKQIKTNNAKVIVLGLAYKKNIKDYRESPSIELIKNLQKIKIQHDYYDPYIPKIKIKNFSYISKKLSSKNLKNYNYVILITDHDIYDFNLIEKLANFIIDTRIKFKKNNKIILA